ncbi:MAG: putative toxin-antitoxin system toxin component, PIN family [Spirochaetes bacterium]|nr:putative toxin-antitoxin system toxin component, PIN family [Spirochaetota bacterium]MBN2771999.1 putative toxin-antitoxin system toxin component, PIN family [Spirochaetota bacterium]
MIIVIDTNVLYQALRGKSGASHFILQLIRNQNISIALSFKVFKEYEDVLKRSTSLKDLSLNISDIDKVLRFLAYTCKPISTYYLFRPNLRDEKDNIFIKSAVSSNAEYLITSNIKDFTISNELKFDDIKIVTPSQFIKLWRKNNHES